ncbi:MAG TPA: outer membrane beta-barrel protein [Candidatus Eisenbacteria bacterium]|nr:outer membrane beta-barrel protein [Candidatus Eisenbacteria bacterium]
MKRNLVLVLMAVVLMAVASTAGAATRPHHESSSNPGTLELNLGYAKSSEDMGGGDTMGGGLAFGAAYWLHPSAAVTWGPEFSYDGLGSVSYDNGFTTNNEASMHLWRVHPTIRYTFTKGVGTQFFGQAGAGLYNVTAKIDDSVLGNASASDSKFGFNLGAGVDFQVSEKTRMNVTGLYHDVATSGSSLNYMQFRAGVAFNL